MISRATEDTITSLLMDELERLGVEAELIPSISTPVGIRKPDLLCRNVGAYPVEAKFSERDLLMAIAKVQNDYLKYHKVLGIKGGFAVLYPEKLSQPMPIEAVKRLASSSRFKLIAMFPPEDARPFKVYEGLLPEITRIPEVNEAVEIVIELGERSGDLENLKRAAWYVVGGDEAFLRTAARRLKYEYLLWRVVAKDDVGKAPGDVIYGAGPKWDTSFRIVITRPEGEVQITPRTAVTAKYIEFGARELEGEEGRRG